MRWKDERERQLVRQRIIAALLAPQLPPPAQVVDARKKRPRTLMTPPK